MLAAVSKHGLLAVAAVVRPFKGESREIPRYKAQAKYGFSFPLDQRLCLHNRAVIGECVVGVDDR